MLPKGWGATDFCLWINALFLTLISAPSSVKTHVCALDSVTVPSDHRSPGNREKRAVKYLSVFLIWGNHNL